jgi:hypothetical protein
MMVPVRMVVPVIVAIVPMIVGRTRLVPWIGAEYPVYAAHRAPDSTADNPANRSCGGVSFRRATLHSPNYALSLNRDWRGKKANNHGYSNFLPHRHVSLLY